MCAIYRRLTYKLTFRFTYTNNNNKNTLKYKAKQEVLYAEVAREHRNFTECTLCNTIYYTSYINIMQESALFWYLRVKRSTSSNIFNLLVLYISVYIQLDVYIWACVQYIDKFWTNVYCVYSKQWRWLRTFDRICPKYFHFDISIHLGDFNLFLIVSVPHRKLKSDFIIWGT